MVFRIHDSFKNQEFLEAVKGKYVKVSFDDQERIFHCHGHTLDEVYKLRYVPLLCVSSF